MRAAFYESDITPPLGCYMTGHGFERIAKNVYNKLYSKALVIEDGGNYAVLIAVDICEYPTELHDKVTKRIEEYTGIRAECVCIHSTHTHGGAPVTDNPEINCYGDDSYKNVFYRLVADSAILAFKRLEECELFFGSVKVPGIAQCRCSLLKDGLMKSFVANPDLIDRRLAEPDNELPVLFVEQNGKKIGALYTFGCHQDTVREKVWGYSGDYSSIVSDYLKEEFGRDFISMYMASPSGDINTFDPYAKTEEEKRKSYTQIGKMLSDGIKAASLDLSCVGEGVSVVKEAMDIPKRIYSPEEFIKMIKRFADLSPGCNSRILNFVYYMQTENKGSARLYIQVIKLGELGIFVYPGEMFSEYAVRTRENSPFKYTMVVENANAYGGYIAPSFAYSENSLLYETSPAYDSFVAKEGGEILYNRLMELANQLS